MKAQGARGHKMPKVLFDEELRSKLHGGEAPLEICEPSGAIVGRFLPEKEFLKLLAAWDESQISAEELARRTGSREGRSLKEIWQRLDPRP